MARAVYFCVKLIAKYILPIPPFLKTVIRKLSLIKDDDDDFIFKDKDVGDLRAGKKERKKERKKEMRKRRKISPHKKSETEI